MLPNAKYANTGAQSRTMQLNIRSFLMRSRMSNNCKLSNPIQCVLLYQFIIKNSKYIRESLRKNELNFIFLFTFSHIFFPYMFLTPYDYHTTIYHKALNYDAPQNQSKCEKSINNTQRNMCEKQTTINIQ